MGMELHPYASFASEEMSRIANVQVVLRIKSPYRDDTTHNYIQPHK